VFHIVEDNADAAVFHIEENHDVAADANTFVVTKIW
jgi:hypothetical protein